ncbi:pyridoxamine 5'-phosphate oxidase family protein [Methylobacterium platani]|uniref:FAD-binding oxidoreductase n=2 Tax=Methylobacterium platani TaxID=427683 RepID=A0A179S8X0_9HYPH|nr:pyridoxamine 5'-phosphate oxidase family protein [Methylobacterium platani]KMO11103.1 FAD-binding oxidoreductase [Methylobacterium platani JCM 14648]OAS23784.1 FAD-binding oxidoreductase [Methylobacterium platani]
MSEPSPWHPGETAIQATVGAVERMAEVGRRVVRTAMPDQHRAFFAQLPVVVAGSVDAGGAVWATLLAGPPGFLAAPTPTELTLAARPDPADPAAEGLRPGEAVGLLGIALDTRRRNRANGVLVPSADGSLRIAVTQSFGNCPQYITLRDTIPAADPGESRAGPVEESAGLDAAARALIAAADTFFVATYADTDGGRQVDVSHRGGRPGFVRVDPDGTLTVPDFSGNLFFATLGNIWLNGRAGLVFPDFATGDLLQLTGAAEVILDSPEIAAVRGAERLWRVRPHRVVRRRGALPMRWSDRPAGASPQALATGAWPDAAATGWRPYRVTRIVEESRTIRSFHLAPADGAGPDPFLAGQHLPIRVTLPGADAPVARTYTLSAAPSDDGYRLSVKREGAVSRHLHDAIRVGDGIEARAPAGRFTIAAGAARPAVLQAGGVGITPLLAMLRHVVHEGARTGRTRPVTLVYAARSLAERAFDGELAALVAAAHGAVRLVRVLGDVAGARAGRDYDAAGRIDAALVARHAPLAEAEVFLCGPAAFTQALYDALRARGVPDARIRAEAFGPAALVRTGAAPRQLPATGPVPVAFLDAAREARWTPEAGSLLDLAEAQGLAPAFACREGWCGTCRTRLVAGAVTYPRAPAAAIAEGEVLPCCAVPATGADRVSLAL